MNSAIRQFLTSVGIVVAMISVALADSEKSQYHLFNPTPRVKMRPFITDRPSRTESPHSIDAGHFAFESDLISAIIDSEEGSKRTDYLFNFINLKLGLTNYIDLQLLFQTYNLFYSNDAGTTATRRGYGDSLVRLKINVFGNDSGSIALGVMPFIKLPTSQNEIGNNRVEGGFMTLFSMDLPAEFSAGTMIQWNRTLHKSPDDDRFGHELVNSVVLSRTLYGDLTMYAELFSIITSEGNDPWKTTFNTGLTFLATPDMQIDTGVNIGISDAADDWNPFFGISMRF